MQRTQARFVSRQKMRRAEFPPYFRLEAGRIESRGVSLDLPDSRRWEQLRGHLRHRPGFAGQLVGQRKDQGHHGGPQTGQSGQERVSARFKTYLRFGIQIPYSQVLYLNFGTEVFGSNGFGNNRFS